MKRDAVAVLRMWASQIEAGKRDAQFLKVEAGVIERPGEHGNMLVEPSGQQTLVIVTYVRSAAASPKVTTEHASGDDEVGEES